MKYLKIENGDGLFLKDIEKKEYFPISEMISSDIYNILLSMGTDEDITFDEGIDDIKNDATKITYDNLLKKFKDFVEKKDEIKNEIDERYKPLEEKYLKVKD